MQHKMNKYMIRKPHTLSVAKFVVYTGQAFLKIPSKI